MSSNEAPVLRVKFRSKDVAKFERQNGSIFNAIKDIEDYTIDNLVRLVRAGNGHCEEDMAYDIIDEYLDNGGDTFTAFADIMKALEDGGFFPRNVGIGQKMEAMIAEIPQEVERAMMEEQKNIVSEE